MFLSAALKILRGNVSRTNRGEYTVKMDDFLRTSSQQNSSARIEICHEKVILSISMAVLGLNDLIFTQ